METNGLKNRNIFHSLKNQINELKLNKNTDILTSKKLN